MKRIAATLVLTAALLAPGPAQADDKADCIAAFEEAQTALASGKLTVAIPKFAVCSRDVCPQSMQKRCVEKATEASSLLPSVVLSATDGANNAVVDAKVTVDGVVVATVLDGKAIPLDPGLHTFRFEKEGLAPVERRVAIKEAQKGQSVAVQFAPTEPVAPPVVPVVAPVVPTPPPVVTPEPPTTASRSSWTPLRWTGLAAGAAGVVGIGVGSAFGVTAFSKWSDAKAQCGTSCAPSSQASSTKSTGETDGNISTVAFIAGGVLVATGVVLFLLAPSKRSTASAAVTPAPGGLQVVGRF